MHFKLVRAELQDADRIWRMQVESFRDLYAKYQDTETSPATEQRSKIILRLDQPATYYYFIQADGVPVGAIRVVDKKTPGVDKRISPLFILPDFRGKGYAQMAIRAVEEIHGTSGWALDTILQEAGNCYLYEKMGYRKTGKTEQINEKMTLVDYRKD